MKTKLLTLIFAMLLGHGAIGQGAETISKAWNSGTPNQFWFVLETDINAAGDDWDPPQSFGGLIDPKQMGFNEELPLVGISAGTTITPPLNLNYLRKTNDFYAEQLFNPCPATAAIPSFEEWYIIKVPSTKNINIVLTPTLPSDPLLYFLKNFQWYEFDVLCNMGACGVGQTCVRSGEAQASPSPGTVEAIITASSKYIALRIGNNQYSAAGAPYFTEYTLSVYTTNNTCDKALKSPVQSGTNPTVLPSALNDVKKSLLADNYPITNGGEEVNIYGSGDYNTNPSNNYGTWFRATKSPVQNLSAASCGSVINPQLLIFSTCVNGVPGKIIGGEDQNIDNPDAESAPYPANFNETWNRLFCIPTSDLKWPVITFPSDGNEYYYYLYSEVPSGSGEYNFYILSDYGNTLPVDWLDFTGQSLGNSNRLNWSTATETQNDYFVLEKSSDGINYETLAQIPGQGDAIFQNDYSTLDESPYYQTYYRISQIDYDGTVNTGPQTVVINDSKKVYINLLTNPVTNNEIKLRYRSDREQEVVFFLTGTDGKAVRSQSATFIEGAAELSIPIPNLAPGMYLFSATLNNERWVEKVVVR